MGYAVSRARWRVVPTPGITVIGAPGAAAAAVMPGVRRTPGRGQGRDARRPGAHPGAVGHVHGVGRVYARVGDVACGAECPRI